MDTLKRKLIKNMVLEEVIWKGRVDMRGVFHILT